MKKAVFLVLPFLLIFMTTCQSFEAIVQEPKASFNTVDIAGISFDGVDLIARVDVENPNAFPIPLPKIDWELFINSSHFINGSLPSDNTIGSRGRVTMDFPLSVTYEELYRSLASVIDSGEAAYNIALDILFSIPVIGDKVYRLDFSGEIPILKLPEISFQGITRGAIGLTSMEFHLNWEVDNRNNFAMNIGEFIYDFSVNNSRWAVGSIANPPEVKANGKTAIPLTVSISALSMVSELTRIISSGSAVNYNIAGNMSLLGGFPGLKLDLPLDLQGTTRIR